MTGTLKIRPVQISLTREKGSDIYVCVEPHTYTVYVRSKDGAKHTAMSCLP